MTKCYFYDECGSTDTTFCKLCNEYFCAKCRVRYKDRMIAMIKKKFPNWFSSDEVEQMKKNGTWQDG